MVNYGIINYTGLNIRDKEGINLIEQVKLKSIATYDDLGANLDNLKRINFIYGNNGAGKTTISELIRKELDFPSCSIEWKDRKMVTYVYNRNFVNENFHLDNPIKGIFTLGKDSVDLKLQIEQLKGNIEKHKESITDLRERFEIKSEEKESLIAEFTEKCWDIKKEVDHEFKDAIEGYRNSKEKFMRRCIQASNHMERELKTLEILKTKKKSLYDRPMEKVEFFRSILFDEGIEDNQIFKQKIIGKEDVDLAELITKLNISDWVQQGYDLIPNDNNVCPFCQQTLPERFEEKLSSYFDQTYITQIEQLNDFIKEYEEEVQSIISQVDSLSNNDDAFINVDKIRHLRELIKSKFEENLLLIQQKKKEPSRVVELVLFSQLIREVNKEINYANDKVREYNALIDNAKAEKENLTADVWRFIAEKIEKDFSLYNKKESDIDKALGGLKNAKENKNRFKKQYEMDLMQLQEKTTSVEHSVSEINRTLSSFGFKNFQISYCI